MQSTRHIVTVNKPTPNFVQAGCPFCRTANSVKALKGEDSCNLYSVISVDLDAVVEPEASTSTPVIAEQLPEGFFDDPKLDAKVSKCCAVIIGADTHPHTPHTHHQT